MLRLGESFGDKDSTGPMTDKQTGEIDRRPHTEAVFDFQ